MSIPEEYLKHPVGSSELVSLLVEEHHGWASAIARSVARSWNLDWQLDGLDGGAYEGLVFCANRYDPSMGVPFRAYARRRIHEAATEEARKSKSWQRGVGCDSEAEQASREISAKLFNVFPELREGLLPAADGDGEEATRNSIRQLLSSAGMMAALNELGTEEMERSVEYRRMVEVLAECEPVHQQILWKVYWHGYSMRGLAEEWGIDELNVIREHKLILEHVCNRLSNPKKNFKKLKIRPGLRSTAQQMKKADEEPPFERFRQVAVLVVAFICSLQVSGWLL